MQWNHDVVSVPPLGAVVLAHTEAGIQALRVGNRAWGLQSHPEVDLDTVRGWAAQEVDHQVLSREVADIWLTQLEAADAAVMATWRPVTERFARLMTGAAPAPSDAPD